MITAYIDGGSRGNPGPAGYGVRIATNNVAEYRGLLAALTWALAHGHTAMHVRSDSELLVRQMKGEYRVKNADLQPLFEEARRLAARVGQVTFEHVRRERNRDADRLANLAMDKAAAQ
jgi:ribonuclease HI